jgi:hypothetical protein
VPAGAVEQQDGMRSFSDGAGDFIEVELHGFGIGVGESQGSACAAGRADRAEQIGALIALVGWLSGPRSALGPLPYEAILLADPRLVLEPDLDGLSPRKAAQMRAQRGREVFLNASMTC